MRDRLKPAVKAAETDAGRRSPAAQAVLANQDEAGPSSRAADDEAKVPQSVPLDEGKGKAR